MFNGSLGYLATRMQALKLWLHMIKAELPLHQETELDHTLEPPETKTHIHI